MFISDTITQPQCKGCLIEMDKEVAELLQREALKDKISQLQ
jgi:hypothetical protein